MTSKALNQILARLERLERLVLPTEPNEFGMDYLQRRAVGVAKFKEQVAERMEQLEREQREQGVQVLQFTAETAPQ